MYLFDTNILSEVLKRNPKYILLERLSKISGNAQFTSSICLMELRYGSSLRLDHKIFWERIEKELLSKINILPITNEIAIKAGDIAADLRTRGFGISSEDLLIGATAITEKMILITANEKHFKYIKELKTENWLSTHSS